MGKVILISVDGMRPDGFVSCGNEFTKKIMQMGSYTLEGRTVMPSVTLPCHMSMFHSVPPERHGILSNSYMPLARPLNGLFEQLFINKKNCAMFYGWEPLRDISRPGTLNYSGFINYAYQEYPDDVVTDMAMDRINKSKPDFVFLYLCGTDSKGHKYGWMTPEYLEQINTAIENIKRVYNAVGQEYSIVITSDHGGHDRMHGMDIKEDMTIPMFFIGKEFEPGKVLNDVSIIDIAPTIADIMGVDAAEEWEGKSVIK